MCIGKLSGDKKYTNLISDYMIWKVHEIQWVLVCFFDEQEHKNIQEQENEQEHKEQNIVPCIQEK